jgi:proton-translocating NADH-quinone oxidoreductase, chain N
MNYGQFLTMMPEVTLMAILVITFICDFISAGKERRWFNPVVCLLMLAHLAINIMPSVSLEAFGGMYQTNSSISVIKSILALGAFIVLIQSRTWLARKDTSFKEGEFYLLLISTLLGMNMMVSANHFLLFFLGLEMASVPMACLVAFDKYRHHSAEAGAKFILTATFSSGVMLYGISFLYGATGTLYFNDMQTLLHATPLTIMGLVFFFSGLGFKISLVPFHFWTADSYQGAPTTVTGYLSVVSKGAASFALLTILMKVFSNMIEQWQYMLYIVIVLSITIANLFAIRQTELKRFMAFSSISQAGYIMLAVVANNSLGIAALSYYVLIYVVANMAVFTIIGIVEEHNNGTTEMESYNGLYSTNPKLSLIMTLALFSLGGIPPFAGMFSKFFVFMSAVEQGNTLSYAIVFIALINTVVSLYYYLLIVKAMYINKNDKALPTFKSDVNTKVALTICTAGILLLGVCSFVFEYIMANVTL